MTVRIGLPSLRHQFRGASVQGKGAEQDEARGGSSSNSTSVQSGPRLQPGGRCVLHRMAAAASLLASSVPLAVQAPNATHAPLAAVSTRHGGNAASAAASPLQPSCQLQTLRFTVGTIAASVLL